MKILALDFSTNTGYAISPGQVSGVKNLKPKSAQRPGGRYQKLRALLKLLHAEHVIEMVVIEQALPGNQRSFISSEYAHGYTAVAQLWCADNNIPLRMAHSGTIKKFITGKGNATKDTVMDVIRARGFRPIDDNEADALALMLWAMQGEPA